MARTRKTSKEALEEKIEKAEADVIAAKKKYDQATANLKELLDKRDAIRKEEILSAVVKSGLQAFCQGISDIQMVYHIPSILSQPFHEPDHRYLFLLSLRPILLRYGSVSQDLLPDSFRRLLHNIMCGRFHDRDQSE